MYIEAKSILQSNLFYRLQISVYHDWFCVFFVAEIVTPVKPSLLQAPIVRGILIWYS